MIKSFADERTAKLYGRERIGRIPVEIQRAGLRKLRMLNNARSIRDLRSPPGNRLEKLKGKRASQYSIRVNDRWRVCFERRSGNAYEVEMTDYH